jgi:hypothetical protein
MSDDAWWWVEPVAGHYRVRLRVYGELQTVCGITARPLLSIGPWLPVLVWHGCPPDPITGLALDRAPRWQALLAGQPVDLTEVWPWASRHRLTEAEYEQLLNGRVSDE